MYDATALESDQSEFVEFDPTGRYGRYNEILGKGASKTVYRAFDEYEGIEVAWNQVKLYDFLQNPEDLERLYCEIHLLKTLKHRNIMKFYTSWVDPANRNINFVTEMFTSGTLRQYRLKHKRVNIRAVKHWCRQILEGLLYLHSHDPPVIHRDLKCDNIFINGNQGEVKIGDLGLAAIHCKSHTRCVGTLEFMAPEVYEEEYNELVDIYSFGMCILELVTFEYPYSECTHPSQIYQKVISGKKPDALYKVKNLKVRQFVEKCLTTVSHRLSARELLMDPFLQIDDNGNDLKPQAYCSGFDVTGPMIRQPLLRMHHNNISLFDRHSNYLGYEPENELGYCYPSEYDLNVINLFTSQEDGQLENDDISIKGRRTEDDGIFLRLRIADTEGRPRYIYFPFDIETDTALTVATEMVAMLDITNQCVTTIADMIDDEIASLVPDWESGLKLEEEPHCTKSGHCQDGALDCSIMDSLGIKNQQVRQCSGHGCSSSHRLFEEITHQCESSEQCVAEGAPANAISSQSGGSHYTHVWEQHGEPELCSEESIHSQSSDECDPFDKSALEKDESLKNVGQTKCNGIDSLSLNDSADCTVAQDYKNEMKQELRWLKANYDIQLREFRDQQLGLISKSLNSTLNTVEEKQKEDKLSSTSSFWMKEKEKHVLSSFTSMKLFKDQHYEAGYGSCSPQRMATGKSFCTEALLPYSHHRASSLPVEAINF